MFDYVNVLNIICDFLAVTVKPAIRNHEMTSSPNATPWEIFGILESCFFFIRCPMKFHKYFGKTLPTLHLSRQRSLHSDWLIYAFPRVTFSKASMCFFPIILHRKTGLRAHCWSSTVTIALNKPSLSHLAHVLLFYANISTNRKRASSDKVSLSKTHRNTTILSKQRVGLVEDSANTSLYWGAFSFANLLCHLWTTNRQYHKVASSLHMISLGNWLIL